MKLNSKPVSKNLLGKFVITSDGVKGEIFAYDDDHNLYVVRVPNASRRNGEEFRSLTDQEMLGWSVCDTREQRDAIFAQKDWMAKSFSVAAQAH